MRSTMIAAIINRDSSDMVIQESRLSLTDGASTDAVGARDLERP